MFAVIAAVLFGLALIFDLAKIDVGTVLTTSVLLEAGLLCVALHLAGLGATTSRPSWNWRRTARRR
ncbi:MAG TPA: hypothetical protein VH333_15935 [Pseudonocardiaceae bacterium]|jgi:hypothetical protein|nr:hypothetical protein [Pseudonocardiaceae bacterium]